MLIRCDQTGIVYSSIVDAAKSMDLHRTCVSENVRGLKDHVKGFTFSKVKNAGVPFVRQPRRALAHVFPAVRLKCNQTGVVFESMRHACRELNLNRTRLRQHLQDRDNYPSTGGYSFTIV